jgi:hypothetical protein
VPSVATLEPAEQPLVRTLAVLAALERLAEQTVARREPVVLREVLEQPQVDKALLAEVLAVA